MQHDERRFEQTCEIYKQSGARYAAVGWSMNICTVPLTARDIHDALRMFDIARECSKKVESILIL